MKNFVSRNKEIDEMINSMTVEEKVSQLTNSSAPIERLGIKAYNWWNEALHGVARSGFATVFPQAIGLAAMFDDEFLYEIASAIADEARAKYNEYQKNGEYGIYQGLTYWSPNVNIFRDPRWGRGHETYGEDPYLSGTLGCAFIRGLQQDDGKHMKAAACAKHFAVHSGPEGIRHGFNVDVSKKDLYETYLPAFEMCVKDAGVEAVMGAYNAVNGSPCCASKELLIDILRDEWGFEGHVVSDCGAIQDIFEHHKKADDIAEAAAMSLKNGCDLNCGKAYESLYEAYERDLITEGDLDTALKRLLRTKFKLGMFDNDVSYSSITPDVIACEKYKKLALEAAKRSIVLLKNNGILPLVKDNLCSIALIGPNADSKEVLLGNYNGIPTQYSTVLSGLTDYIDQDINISYCKGSDLAGEIDETLISEAADAAKSCDVSILCLGLDASLEGEQGDAFNSFVSGDKPDIQLPSCQQRLLEVVCKNSRKVIVLLMCGSAIAINYANEHADAIVNTWYPGEMGGRAIAEMLFGEYSPGGRLPVTFYKSDSDLPDFKDYSMVGRTYRFFQSDALFPFGYGLSYNDYEYTNITVDTDNITNENGVALFLNLKNNGKYEGYETVQVYVSSPADNSPRWQLKLFKSIHFDIGEEKQINLYLPRKAFETVDINGNRSIAGGQHKIFIGHSQPDSISYELTGKQLLIKYINIELNI